MTKNYEDKIEKLKALIERSYTMSEGDKEFLTEIVEDLKRLIVAGYDLPPAGRL